MAKGTVSGQRPRGCARLLLRAPIALYRTGLGFVLGGRFVMLEHTGRQSGKSRYTVLEVVRHDREADTYVVASGWGERSDWFRNIQKTPEVRISTGLRRRLPGRALRLPRAEAERELCDYARRHPRASATLSRFMIGEDGGDCRAVARAVPVVALKVASRRYTRLGRGGPRGGLM
ncbi:MAG: nitroreductase family deazaflavin-dependent oxidoreductase [Anaerolineae bacterium]|nr:nitroreductase family deazaflavin-dependent oxidoreductase [Anaerolineae bacterium]